MSIDHARKMSLEEAYKNPVTKYSYPDEAAVQHDEALKDDAIMTNVLKWSQFADSIEEKYSRFNITPSNRELFYKLLDIQRHFAADIYTKDLSVQEYRELQMSDHRINEDPAPAIFATSYIAGLAKMAAANAQVANRPEDIEVILR